MDRQIGGQAGRQTGGQKVDRRTCGEIASCAKMRFDREGVSGASSTATMRAVSSTATSTTCAASFSASLPCSRCKPRIANPSGVCSAASGTTCDAAFSSSVPCGDCKRQCLGFEVAGYLQDTSLHTAAMCAVSSTAANRTCAVSFSSSLSCGDRKRPDCRPQSRFNAVQHTTDID